MQRNFDVGHGKGVSDHTTTAMTAILFVLAYRYSEGKKQDEAHTCGFKTHFDSSSLKLQRSSSELCSVSQDSVSFLVCKFLLPSTCRAVGARGKPVAKGCLLRSPHS